MECWPPPAQHEQAQDGDSVAEVVDEGHIVDECVCVTHEHDDRGGPALGEDRGLTAGLPPASGHPCGLLWAFPLRSGGQVSPSPSPPSTASLPWAGNEFLPLS